ncbi:hypothetical protein ACET3Z_018148 [Daucus carota]
MSELSILSLRAGSKHSFKITRMSFGKMESKTILIMIHASNIMVKFSDVVDWLKVKPFTRFHAPNKLLKDNNKTSFFGIPPASTTASFAMSWSNPSQNNIISESKDNNEIKKIPEKPGFASSGASAGFPVSWGNPVQNKLFSEIKDTNQRESSENTGSSPAAVSSAFGITWGAPVLNKPASEDINGNGVKPFLEKPGIIAASDDEVEQPSSPSVKKSEEKGVTVVHEMKCKLYVKLTDPADKDAWKDKGAVQLSIKCKEGFSKGSKESKRTIVVRNDEDENNVNVVARTFLIRAKTEDD